AAGDDESLAVKDQPLRVKAPSIGLTAQEYRAELPPDSGWTGMAELDLPPAETGELYETGKLDVPAARELPCHTGLVLAAATASSSSALARVLPDISVQLVRGHLQACGLPVTRQ